MVLLVKILSIISVSTKVPSMLNEEHGFYKEDFIRIKLLF